ncbi:uncharacterized protein N7483_004676 [Penicillium malachiteum]|uniref:uncharacterized protein n=1 Tax=Penicillium malachiteum TaxID=1324776 RepID=UPI002547F7FE|nr:uncharacterized protein N7483_004676 [Penicillium malachiteum]KAJ5730168.1 hypothetical protein N7483_004676 [Penicillium malachiteum]
MVMAQELKDTQKMGKANTLIVQRNPRWPITAKDAREQQIVFYDCDLHQLYPAQCVDAVIEDGTYTVFMTFGYELAINEDIIASVGRALQYRNSHRGRPIQ